MIIRLALLLVIISLSDLLTATLLKGLATTNLAEKMFQVGAILLLAAFTLIFLLGAGFAVRLIFTSFSVYFSTPRRLERRLLFYLNTRSRIERLYQFKKVRILYFNQLRRKRLLLKNDRGSATP